MPRATLFRSALPALSVIVTTLTAGAAARAQNLFYANFESPFYALGNLLGQNTWQVDPIGNAVVTTDKKTNGVASARFDASTTTPGSTWWFQSINHTVVPAKPYVEVSCDMYAASNTTLSGSWGIQVFDPSLRIFAFAFVSSAATTPNKVFQLDYSLNTAVNTGFTMERNRWYRWKMVLNFSTRTYKLFIDGQQVGTEVIFDDFLPPTNTIADADIRVSTPGNDSLYVDHFKVAAFANPPCDGDIDNNRAVDTNDLVTLLGSFGGTVTPATGADFNGDGLVNTEDLVFMLGTFGRACP